MRGVGVLLHRNRRTPRGSTVDTDLNERSFDGTNPLDPASMAGRPDRDVRRGHGTKELGPSDSSDSGSDISEGADIGDASLDNDTDRSGTGERASASGHAEPEAGADIDTDHIESLPEEIEEEENRGDGKRRKQ